MIERRKKETKKVRIFLLNGFCYTGLVLSEDENFLNILDRFGLHITLNKKTISTIVEIEDF